MTTAHPVLVARDVHVVYRTPVDDLPPLRQRMLGRRDDRSRFREVHAVRGVDLTLYEGESIGIVGSNGSGKTSLVTALSGLIEIQRGEIQAVARPAMLGVGAALNRSLSGRRNIVLGLLALGLTKAEIDERMHDIIAFSGLRESIDRPMKTYSSGMKARLAFTIATEVSPEILIVDEALSVGDRRFRVRAAERLEAIREAAGSIIVVSHNLNEISSMCTRVVWMEEGEVIADGDADEVLAQYESDNPPPHKAQRSRGADPAAATEPTATSVEGDASREPSVEGAS